MAEHTQEEELQMKYYEFQMVGEQIKQFQQQLQMLEEQAAELNVTLDGLNDLEKTKAEESILVPIGQGIFTKAELKDHDNLIINVGSNILVSKSISGTKDMLSERLNAVDVYRQETNSTIAELAQKAHRLEEELQAMLTGMRG